MFSDTVLVLPTAGTTGAPKLVPLTKNNIDASRKAWVEVLGLTATDRCLNCMPFWHGSSVIATGLASASVGATVVNVPKPSLYEFWCLLTQHKPTWIPLPCDLAKAILGDERIFAPVYGLRFIRLSKATLSPAELRDLERIFRCSVISSYGMTEAGSGPVASERLNCRRPGSVGKPAHLEVRIDQDGQILIRGPSVMAGYVSGPPDIFTFSWVDGERWMNTRDRGHFDSDGFLYLDGRG